MFFKKYFLFYLPKLYKYEIVRAKDESEAVWKLINSFRLREKDIDNYKIIKYFNVIK